MCMCSGHGQPLVLVTMPLNSAVCYLSTQAGTPHDLEATSTVPEGTQAHGHCGAHCRTATEDGSGLAGTCCHTAAGHPHLHPRDGGWRPSGPFFVGALCVPFLYPRRHSARIPLSPASPLSVFLEP